ncbi:MAG: ROK family protein [Acidobacteriaceae bacterium]|nr:ROK family protein [Acidobacteriaceae bacterium]
MPTEVALPADRTILCADIGATSTKAGFLDSRGELHYVDAIPTQPDPESFVDNLCALVDSTLAAVRENNLTPRGLGVAVAGFLDEKRERLLYNSNLSWLENFPLRPRLAAHFSFPVELEIDSNSACMAEYLLGSGRGSRRFLCVTCGTGLGVGMTVNGQPLRFAYGCMGDIGHVLVKRDGPLCTCGGRGCAEIMVSAPALAAEYKRRAGLPDEVTLRSVITAAQSHDPVAISVLTEAGEWLGMAIASMANILFPDHIAIAGGLSAAGDLLLTPAQRVFCESAALFARSQTTISLATLGPMTTLIGAAWPFWAT